MGRVIAFVVLIISLRVFFPELIQDLIQVLATMIMVVQEGLELFLSGFPTG